MTNFEKIEDNKIKITFSVGPDALEKALDTAYKRKKDGIAIPGFRKGKITRKIIETRLGEDVFLPDAVNIALQEAYPKAVNDLPEELVTASHPEIGLLNVNRGAGAEFEAKIHLLPEAAPGNYKGLTYKPFDAEITEEELQRAIEFDRDKNARLVTVTEPRPIKDGDSVIIDYEGFLGEEAFEGGAAKEYELIVGSGTFIAGFEEQLIGHNLQEEFEIGVKFPEEYHSKDLAGRDAVFKIRVNEIRDRILPELDDDFAQDVSDFDTFAEYKEDLRRRMKASAEDSAAQKRDAQIIEEFVKGYEVTIPPEVLEYAIDEEQDNLAAELRYRYMTITQYCDRLGLNRDSLREILRPRAEETVKLKAGLLKVAELENVTTDEEALRERMKESGLSEAQLGDVFSGDAKYADFIKDMRVKARMYKANQIICEAGTPDPQKEISDALAEQFSM
ncbi:MAG: trigger factor [Clostridiales bacterium]|jgi:trigger factor|nr:trigger factor [Clostridiales bacterium]